MAVNGRQVLKGKLLKASLGVRGAIQEKVNKVKEDDANEKAEAGQQISEPSLSSEGR